MTVASKRADRRGGDLWRGIGGSLLEDRQEPVVARSRKRVDGRGADEGGGFRAHGMVHQFVEPVLGQATEELDQPARPQSPLYQPRQHLAQRRQRPGLGQGLCRRDAHILRTIAERGRQARDALGRGKGDQRFRSLHALGAVALAQPPPDQVGDARPGKGRLHARALVAAQQRQVLEPRFGDQRMRHAREHPGKGNGIVITAEADQRREQCLALRLVLPSRDARGSDAAG